MRKTAIETQTKELALIDKVVSREEIEMALAMPDDHETCTDCDPNAPCDECAEHSEIRPMDRPVLKSSPAQTNDAETAYNFNILIPGKSDPAAATDEKKDAGKISTGQWIQYGVIALVVVMLLLLLFRKKSPTT